VQSGIAEMAHFPVLSVLLTGLFFTNCFKLGFKHLVNFKRAYQQCWIRIFCSWLPFLLSN